jgi:hypothetical protein
MTCFLGLSELQSKAPDVLKWFELFYVFNHTIPNSPNMHNAVEALTRLQTPLKVLEQGMPEDDLSLLQYS